MNPRAYERLDERQLGEVLPEVRVIRAFALDTQRHLAWRGRYLRCLTLPDRWASWCLGAIPVALREIRRHRISVIFTTFPIATAVLIGWVLHRLTGKPWVVDFRDSMTEEGYPRDRLTWRVWRWIERQAIEHASLFIFTAPAARQMYLNRYPRLEPQRCLVIPNGYDEPDFQHLMRSQPTAVPESRPLRLVHSGLVYPEERDPRAFFSALSQLKSAGSISAATLQIDLRAPGSESYHSQLLKDFDIEDLVRLLPPLPYSQSLQDDAAADGLLLLQAAWCNHQIPAKAYEYLRVGRPILALTPQEGDTAGLLQEVGGGTIIDLSNVEAIVQRLPGSLECVRQGQHPLPDPEKVQRYDRRKQAQQLAASLEGLLPQRPKVQVQDVYPASKPEVTPTGRIGSKKRSSKGCTASTDGSISIPLDDGGLD